MSVDAQRTLAVVPKMRKLDGIDNGCTKATRRNVCEIPRLVPLSRPSDRIKEPKMDEATAKTKWCPMAEDHRDRCLASDCMLWRTKRKCTKQAAIDSFGCIGGNCTECDFFLERGYCSLGGKP